MSGSSHGWGLSHEIQVILFGCSSKFVNRAALAIVATAQFEMGYAHVAVCTEMHDQQL